MISYILPFAISDPEAFPKWFEESSKCRVEGTVIDVSKDKPFDFIQTAHLTIYGNNDEYYDLQGTINLEATCVLSPFGPDSVPKYGDNITLVVQSGSNKIMTSDTYWYQQGSQSSVCISNIDKKDIPIQILYRDYFIWGGLLIFGILVIGVMGVYIYRRK